MSFLRKIADIFPRSLQLCRSNVFYQSAETNVRSIHTLNHPLCFQSTPVLNAEPLKRRKKMDPSVMRGRTEKKIKRIQRDIRKLEKVAKQFKPIAEHQVPKKVVQDSERVRPEPQFSSAEIQEHAMLKQMWAIYKKKESDAEMNAIKSIVSAQERAMDALQETSPELYEQALQPDLMFIPFTMTGPTETPPIEGHDYPDGDFIDTTKQYIPLVPTDPKKKRRLELMRKSK